MKWDLPNGSVQYTTDRCYMVMRATSEHWIAYRMSAFQNAAEKLGERGDEEAARACCELAEHTRIAEKRA